ncbi:MAG: phosphoglycerate kinase [Calditrichaeota bacterium]|nr:MAG: phosphoglycerate kinase [Calditrichota bacterium]
MNKLTVDDLNFRGQTTLVRVDFNVPLDSSRHITDDFRIRAALPTIKKIISDGGRAVLCSHLGRPKGKRVESLSLAPVAARLSELLGRNVQFAHDCIGQQVEEMKKALKDGDVLLLENLRFHPGEEANDPEFARQLASHCQLYVNDAFGTAHRAHASTVGVTRFFDRCAAGYLMKKELEYLGKALEHPDRPFVAVLGGAKISGKIDVINNLLNKTDALLLGGGMVFTFFKAQGLEIGKSILEPDRLEMAAQILQQAQSSNCQLHLPVDVMVADRLEAGAQTRVVPVNQIPSDWLGVDIGPETIMRFKEILSTARTVVWNGPMGVFEIPDFARGTEAIARHLAEITRHGATTIVGGGDSAAAVKQFGLMDQISHVSTGGGASLEFLEGKVLPGVAALTDKS